MLQFSRVQFNFFKTNNIWNWQFIYKNLTNRRTRLLINNISTAGRVNRAPGITIQA